jgi:hypothetical protein
MRSGDDIGPLLPRYVFWDVKRESLDFSKDRSFIISRIFERGKMEDVLGIIHIYGKEEAGKVLRDNKYLSRQGLYLAHTLLGLPLQDFKSYAQLQHD